MDKDYQIGEVITLKENKEAIGLLGNTKTVCKGSKAIVTADGNLRFFNGCAISLLDQNVELEGYDSYGIAEYIVHHLSCWLPVQEMLDSEGLTKNNLISEIEDALIEIGLN